MLSDSQFLRYQRQVCLSDIGEVGQQRLLHSHVLVIGCGGLGSAAIMYLASAGVGKLVIVDDDAVDSSNLQRQVIYRQSDLEQSKVLSVQKQVANINPDCQVRTVGKRMDDSQLSLEVMLADLVLDCCDNMPTRQSINKACFNSQTPLVTAAAIGWQGQLSVFDFTGDDVPCYRCAYPFDELPQEMNCAAGGIVGPVVGTMGNLQALAAIQKISVGEFLLPTNTIKMFDGKSMDWQQLSITKDSQCTTCSK
ncbi:HesA/MoeB/ThiF family protein [Vibrio paucivorans]|uniref:HesA/MoeB/ThiF family protein n=1 Tax=Vibrio paucivorans TaxID=2829489 RepID=A0A9X3HT46_9VIBR|nr:HesA/MoeB/ThiF family protein [Vibrio paucivorans]MCW8334812.1 HesA/MoeB/ThiF family protein [Vibrio paucivorans]